MDMGPSRGLVELDLNSLPKGLEVRPSTHGSKDRGPWGSFSEGSSSSWRSYEVHRKPYAFCLVDRSASYHGSDSASGICIP